MLPRSVRRAAPSLLAPLAALALLACGVPTSEISDAGQTANDSGAGSDAPDATEGDGGSDAEIGEAAAADAAPDAPAPDASGDAPPDAPDAGPASEAGPCNTVAPAGGGGVLDITTFGASPDGGDATGAIQAAIDQACTTGEAFYNRPPPVFIPLGTYATSKPLLIHCNNLEVLGACRSGSILAPQFNGPTILMNPEGGLVVPTLGPALVGTGSSFATESDHFVYVNLRDIPDVELDGLGAFTAEAFIEQTSAYAPGYGSIVDSYGCNQSYGTALPCGAAFDLGVQIQSLYGQLTVAGTSYELNGPTVTLNTVHHAALTYDGATIRLFLDGAVVASTAATGAVSMQPQEDVTIGGLYYGLEASEVDGAMPGFVDSVRLSNVARYTAAFTPSTTELPSDGSTLALATFDTGAPGLTLAASKDGPFWLPVRRQQQTNGQAMPEIGGVQLHDFTVQGGMGIVGWTAVTSRFYQLDCLGCDYGFAMLGQSWEDSFDDVRATAGGGRGRYGIYDEGGNGDGFHDVVVSGQTFPLVTVSAAEQIITNVSVTAGPSTMYGMTFLNGDEVLDGVQIDATAAGAAWRGAIGAIMPWAKLQLQRGTIATRGGAPAIVLDQGAGVLIEGTSFTGTAQSPEVVHVIGPTTAPDIVVGATKDSNVAWSDDAALVTPASDPATVPDPTTLPAFDPGPSVLRGQVPTSQVFDVTAYGAQPGGTDAAPGIQAAVDAACMQTGSTVLLPNGNFWVGSPVVVHCDGLTVQGASHSDTWLFSLNANGPGLILEPQGMTGVDVAPALVGTGNAMKTDGASYWLELRDEYGVELDGLSAFTAEAFVDLSAALAGYGGILQSHGCLGTGASLPGCTSAFSLAAMNQTLVGSMSIGGATFSLQGPTLALGAVHHVALSYDGSAVRLFLDGALAASQTASGAIAQGQFEDVTAGPRTTGFDGAAQDPAIPGVIDSIRLSKVARYTAAFTPPTAKLATDGNALLLLNFDANAHGSTEGIEASGSGIWLPVRRTAEPNGTPEPMLTGVTLRGFMVGADLGVFGMNATAGRYLELGFSGSDYGVVLDGSSAGSYFEDLEVGVGGRGRYGLVAVGGDGNLYHDLWLSYAKVPLAIYGGQDQVFAHTFLTPDPATSVYGSYFLHAGQTLLGMYFDNESAMPVYAGNVVAVDSLAPFTLLKGELDLTTRGIPITIDGGKGVIVEGTSFGGSSVSPEIIHVSAPTTGTTAAVGITFATGVPLSDDSGMQSIGN